MKVYPFLLTMTLAVISSCSIKEERGECPCILEINTSITQKGYLVDIAGFDGDSRTLFDRFERDSCPERYEREVKRCYLTISGVLSDRSVEYSMGGRIISLEMGMQADSLFAGVSQVDASGETASSTVSLHKQFTTIRIYQEQEGEETCDYMMEVRGDCAGFDVLSLKPVDGEFHYETPFPKEGTSFRITRMDEESSLWITITDAQTGDAVRSFQISTLMKSAGYDCNAIDLQDVDICVNLVSLDCLLSVKEWSGNVIEIDI